MASFAEIHRSRAGIEDRYFAMVEDAQANREKEYAAALTLQCAWRRYRLNCKRRHRNRMATLIQTAFRKHQARMLVRCLRVEKARAERTAYFNLMAQKIQKVWRGFNSRRHIFDFFKQRQYLAQVAEANERMRRELDDHYAKTNEAERRARFEREKRKQEETALRQHHLVSTSAIPSIFQPPAFTRDAAVMPAIENYIRTVNRAKLVIPSLK